MTRALPALRTYTPGDLVTAAFMNAINYGITFGCLQPPQFQGRQTVTQNLTSGSFVSILLDTEDVDSDAFHSTSTNTSRVVAPWPGWCEAEGIIAIAANTSHRRGGQILINGTTAVPGSEVLYQATDVGASAIAVPKVKFFLNAGDYCELQGFQDSTSTLATTVGAGASCRLTVDFRSE